MMLPLAPQHHDDEGLEAEQHADGVGHRVKEISRDAEMPTIAWEMPMARQ